MTLNDVREGNEKSIDIARQALQRLATVAKRPLTRSMCREGEDSRSWWKRDDVANFYFDEITGFPAPSLPNEVMRGDVDHIVEFVSAIVLLYDEEVKGSSARHWHNMNGDALERKLFMLEYYELYLYKLVSDDLFSRLCSVKLSLDHIEGTVVSLNSICKDMLDVYNHTGHTKRDMHCFSRIKGVLLKCVGHFVRVVGGIFLCFKKNGDIDCQTSDRLRSSLANAYILSLSLCHAHLGALDILPFIERYVEETNELNLSLGFVTKSCDWISEIDSILLSKVDNLFGLRDRVFAGCQDAGLRRIASSLEHMICKTFDSQRNQEVFTSSILGTKQLVRSAREFFYGRNFSSVVNDSSNSKEDSPWRMNNLLIHGPIRAILALKKFPTSANDLDDAIPFLLSLVDESIEELKIVGAACLIKILRYFTPDANENCLTLIEQVLSMACKITKDASSLAILTFALSYVLQSKSMFCNVSKRKNEELCNLFSIVELHRDANTDIALASIVGGIYPLMTINKDKDDSRLVETLRPSLMALLPIIKTKSAIFDFPLVVGCLTCLNVLLKGSWPIIEKHGGKVMSALLICVGKNERVMSSLEFDENLPSYSRDRIKFINSLATQCGSIALVVGGDNANSTLLLAQDQCVDEVKKYCLQIKSKANCCTA